MTRQERRRRQKQRRRERRNVERSRRQSPLTILGTSIQEGRGYLSVEQRMVFADTEQLRVAWAYVVSRALDLERRPRQNHQTKCTREWLRRWECRIGEELHRRETEPPPRELTEEQMAAIVARMQQAALSVNGGTP